MALRHWYVDLRHRQICHQSSQQIFQRNLKNVPNIEGEGDYSLVTIPWLDSSTWQGSQTPSEIAPTTGESWAISSGLLDYFQCLHHLHCQPMKLHAQQSVWWGPWCSLRLLLCTSPGNWTDAVWACPGQSQSTYPEVKMNTRCILKQGIEDWDCHGIQSFNNFTIISWYNGTPYCTGTFFLLFSKFTVL